MSLMGSLLFNLGRCALGHKLHMWKHGSGHKEDIKSRIGPAQPTGRFLRLNVARCADPRIFRMLGAAVERWLTGALEAVVVAGGGCAVTMHSRKPGPSTRRDSAFFGA